MTQTNELPPARVSTDQFKALCTERGYDWDIQWRWDGRERGGVLRVMDGDTLVARVPYGRSTMNWGRGDIYLDRVRTGSNKHLAVLEALALLNK